MYALKGLSYWRAPGLPSQNSPCLSPDLYCGMDLSVVLEWLPQLELLVELSAHWLDRFSLQVAGGGYVVSHIVRDDNRVTFHIPSKFSSPPCGRDVLGVGTLELQETCPQTS